MTSSLFRQTLPDSRWPFRVWDDYQFIRRRRRGGGDPQLVIESPSTASVFEQHRFSHDLLLNWKEPARFQWAVTGGADAAQFEVVFGYPWTLRWIGDGTRDFETPLDANLDNIYEVQVTVTDLQASGTATQLIRVTVLNVLETAPINTALPVVTGGLQVGELLSTTDGIWTGELPQIFTYQWYADGVPIVGAVNPTYLLLLADFGKMISVGVTSTNYLGAVEAQSIAVGPVRSLPVNSVAPVVSGVLGVGETLTVSDGIWIGTAPITYTYQWYKIEETHFNLLLANGVSRLLLANGTSKLLLEDSVLVEAIIAGATLSTFVIPPEGLEDFYWCAVTATNVYGTNGASSNIAGPVV